MSVLQYGCTTWTLTICLEKKLDGNYTRMLQFVFNKSWKQQTTKELLHSHLPPILQSVHVRWTRYAGHCWRSKKERICNVLLWISIHGYTSIGRPAQAYIPQLCLEGLPRAMADKDGWWEKGPKESVLSVCLDDDDDDVTVVDMIILR